MKQLVIATCVMVCIAIASAREPAPPGTSPLDAPPIVSRADWGSKPLPLDESRRQVPRLITLHHAGVIWKDSDEPLAKARALQTWGQKEKNWPDVPYHYLIAPDGRILEGRDWHYQPESNTKYDLDGVLNIQLWGDFESQRVSVDQLRATVKLVAWFCETQKLDPATIRGHQDAAAGQTTCPGRDFYRYIQNGSIRKWVEQSLAGQDPQITPLAALPDGPTTQISTTIITTQPTTRP